MIRHTQKSSRSGGAVTKPNVLARFKNQFRRIATEEDGVASLEFVFVIPFIMAIFMASIESGMLMTRSILLEQSVDMVMRNLRLGQYPAPTVSLLKDEICRRTIIMAGCEDNITIDLQPIDTATWVLPNTNAGCVDRGNNVQPATTFDPGTPHEIVLVRVCVTQDAIFPSTGIGLNLPKDGQGGYGLVAISAFVNEP